MGVGLKEKLELIKGRYNGLTPEIIEMLAVSSYASNPAVSLDPLDAHKNSPEAKKFFESFKDFSNKAQSYFETYQSGGVSFGEHFKTPTQISTNEMFSLFVLTGGEWSPDTQSSFTKVWVRLKLMEMMLSHGRKGEAQISQYMVNLITSGELTQEEKQIFSVLTQKVTLGIWESVKA